MAKIFSQQAELNNHPQRNNFDLSHKIHMTGKMGTLYPTFCKPVVPGDSFKIDSGCAFNFMPMPYPTQTRMRFIQHFFYVRNKNIWSNWENWLQGLPDNDTGQDIVPPYIDQPASFYKTGSLADFLGIPTTFQYPLDSINSVARLMPNGVLDGFSGVISIPLDSNNNPDINAFIQGDVSMYDATNPNKHYIVGFPSTPFSVKINSDRFSFFSLFSGTRFRFGNPLEELGDKPLSFRVFLLNTFLGNGVDYSNSLNFSSTIGGLIASFEDLGFTSALTVMNQNTSQSARIEGRLSDSIVTRVNDSLDQGYSPVLIFVPYVIMSTNSSLPINERYKRFDVSPYNISGEIYSSSSFSSQSYFESSLPMNNNQVDIDSMLISNPYYSSSNQDEDTIKVSALPFRAYESVYNAFYRNQNGNQPFMIDGKTQYNKYNTTIGDGVDTTPYSLMQRNWELDAYTSCLPSPQQGQAPVVGITALGRVTIVDPETGVTTTAQATDTPNGMQFTDVNIGEESHQKYLVNLASSGITINDFRQVNSLQRFLETNIRKGFRYVDFIEGHFGTRIKDSIMDMPEFIGGFSQTVDVNMVTNTTAQKDGDVELLGSYGGQASAFGGTQHSINHYCDDYGFIIGIMCLVPEPTYSQILPKHFNVKQPLDYYFPEFAQIGLQPITYEEVCPVQSHYMHSIDSTKKLTDVFGYQRPNHDMVWFPDTLHGEFRKSFNKFIVNRVYSSRPELGNDFLVIKPEETNSIFNYMAPDNDVFVGQVAYSVKAKRPVPRIVIPALGR